MQLYSSTKACTYQGYTTNVIWSLNVFIAQDQSTSTIRPTTPPQLCFCTNFLGFNVIGWPLWFNESGSYSVPFLHFDVAFGVCHFQSYYKLQDNQVYHLFILGFIQNELFVLERTIYKCITLITSLSNLVRNTLRLSISRYLSCPSKWRVQQQTQKCYVEKAKRTVRVLIIDHLKSLRIYLT